MVVVVRGHHAAVCLLFPPKCNSPEIKTISLTKAPLTLAERMAEE